MYQLYCERRILSFLQHSTSAVAVVGVLSGAPLTLIGVSVVKSRASHIGTSSEPSALIRSGSVADDDLGGGQVASIY